MKLSIKVSIGDGAPVWMGQGKGYWIICDGPDDTDEGTVCVCVPHFRPQDAARELQKVKEECTLATRLT